MVRNIVFKCSSLWLGRWSQLTNRLHEGFTAKHWDRFVGKSGMPPGKTWKVMLIRKSMISHQVPCPLFRQPLRIHPCSLCLSYIPLVLVLVWYMHLCRHADVLTFQTKNEDSTIPPKLTLAKEGCIEGLLTTGKHTKNYGKSPCFMGNSL